MVRSTKPTVTVDLPPKPDPTRGGGGWPLLADHVESWAWRNGVFTEEELDAIIRIGTSSELEKAVTYGPIQDDKTRNSFVQFLFPNSITDWIFGKLTEAIVATNEEFFRFDLSGLEQGLQFTRYTAPGEHYDWHIDRGYLTAPRKLSLSLQLNDPTDYRGGELQFKFGRTNQTVKKERGLITFFPSYTLHRVRPVTAGVRYSLVAWISGPPFR